MRLKRMHEAMDRLTNKMKNDDLKLVIAVISYVMSSGHQRWKAHMHLEGALERINLRSVSKELKFTLPMKMVVSRWHDLSDSQVLDIKETHLAGHQYFFPHPGVSYSRGRIEEHFLKKKMSHGVITEHDLSKVRGFCVPTYLILRWASRIDNFKILVSSLLDNRMFAEVQQLEDSGLLEQIAGNNYMPDDIRSIEFYEEDIEMALMEYAKRQREIMVFSDDMVNFPPDMRHVYLGRSKHVEA